MRAPGERTRQTGPSSARARAGSRRHDDPGEAIIPEAGKLRVEHERDGARHTLRLSGELDMNTDGQVYAAAAQVADEGADGLILDLRQVAFMDSSGLRCVLATWDDCRSRGCEFRLIPDRGACRRLFEITGVLDELPLLEAQ